MDFYFKCISKINKIITACLTDPDDIAILLRVDLGLQVFATGQPNSKFTGFRVVWSRFTFRVNIPGYFKNSPGSRFLALGNPFGLVLKLTGFRVSENYCQGWPDISNTGLPGSTFLSLRSSTMRRHWANLCHYSKHKLKIKNLFQVSLFFGSRYEFIYRVSRFHTHV